MNGGCLVACKPFQWIAPSGDVTSGIACTRGKTKRCDTPNCQEVCVALCDHPVTRNGKPGTCDRKMCKAHQHPAGEDKDLCEVHHKLKEQR